MTWKLLKYVKIAILLLGVLVFIFLLIDYLQEPKSLSSFRENLKNETFVKLSKGLTRYELNILDTTQIVLFIHGGGILGYEVFRKNIDALNEEGISTLAYDQYGRGYSDKPKIKYSSDELYAQLIELIDSLGLKGKKVNVVSLSLGAVLARRFANEHSDLVSNNIFISPSLFGNFNSNFLLKVPVLNYILMTLQWHPQYIEKRRKEFVDLNSYEEYVALIKHFSGIRGFKRIYLSTWLHIMSENHTSSEINSDFLKKVHLIYGDKDPYIVKTSRDKLLLIFADVPQFVIEKAGHMPNFEKSTRVNEILIDILSNN